MVNYQGSQVSGVVFLYGELPISLAALMTLDVVLIAGLSVFSHPADLQHSLPLTFASVETMA